jgi:hypothetical protein
MCMRICPESIEGRKFSPRNGSSAKENEHGKSRRY